MHWTAEDLSNAIVDLPRSLKADAPRRVQGYDRIYNVLGVMREWTMELPLRHQGVLITALRGCDGATKEDASKALACMIRRAILNPADDRETTSERGFFGFKAELLYTSTLQLLHSMDEYPLHYIMHLLHAAQVIAYKHPSPHMRQFFVIVYAMMVHKFHLRQESGEEMDARLTEDRVAKGTVERDF